MKDIGTQFTTEKASTNNDSYLINQINAIKSQLYSINPADFEKLRNLVDSLLTSQDASPELRAILERLQSTILEHEQQAQSVVYSSIESQNREAASNLQDAMVECMENEGREKELRQLNTQYNSFKNDFNKDLEERNQLLQRALGGKLTDKEKAELMGQYANKEEEEVARKQQQEMDRRWAIHYSIEDKANKSIAYRQNEIAKNNEAINHSDTHPKLKTHLSKENEIHKQVISNHKKDLESLKEANNKREIEREVIKSLINNGQTDLVTKKLKEHYKNHEDHYEKEKQKNPDYKGHHELHSLIMACGGHEKLGLPKPQDHRSEQQIVSTQNAKNLTLAQQQTKVLSPQPNLSLGPLEHAEAIKTHLRLNQSIASTNTKVENRYPASNIGSSMSNQDKGNDKERNKDTVSKFSQRRKAMEGYGRR